MLNSFKFIVTHCEIDFCSISGVKYVFDTTFARNFSLLESCKEFVRRYKESETEKTSLPMLASACPGCQIPLKLKAYCHRALTHLMDLYTFVLSPMYPIYLHNCHVSLINNIFWFLGNYLIIETCHKVETITAIWMTCYIFSHAE